MRPGAYAAPRAFRVHHPGAYRRSPARCVFSLPAWPPPPDPAVQRPAVILQAKWSGTPVSTSAVIEVSYARVRLSAGSGASMPKVLGRTRNAARRDGASEHGSPAPRHHGVSRLSERAGAYFVAKQ